MFRSTKTQFLWTDLAETLHPDRKSGTPVYEHYRYTVPRSWLEKGYVVEDTREQVFNEQDGQVTMY